MEVGLIQLITELVNGVGFPVAVCIALFWSNHETSKNHVKIIREFKEVLKENTEALQQLSQKVGNK